MDISFVPVAVYLNTVDYSPVLFKAIGLRFEVAIALVVYSILLGLIITEAFQDLTSGLLFLHKRRITCARASFLID